MYLGSGFSPKIFGRNADAPYVEESFANALQNQPFQNILWWEWQNFGLRGICHLKATEIQAGQETYLASGGQHT